jgi:hypothetical protein
MRSSSWEIQFLQRIGSGVARGMPVHCNMTAAHARMRVESIDPNGDHMAEETPSARPGPEPSESVLSRLTTTRVPVWVPIVLLVLLVLALLWRQIGVSGAERRFAAERQALVQQAEADRSARETQARAALAQSSDDAHVLFGTALAWSVRSAMIRRNLDEVDQYIVTLAQHPRIALVLLADPQGTILLASDRSLLKAPFAKHFPAALLEAQAVEVHPAEGEERRLILPIQGLTERLGTMLVVYTTPALPPRN